MFAENASRGLALVVIRRAILHGRHCTAVAEASAMASRAVYQGGPGSLLRVTGAVPCHPVLLNRCLQIAACNWQTSAHLA
jgi:hypothetical protein